MTFVPLKYWSRMVKILLKPTEMYVRDYYTASMGFSHPLGDRLSPSHSEDIVTLILNSVPQTTFRALNRLLLGNGICSSLALLIHFLCCDRLPG